MKFVMMREPLKFDVKCGSKVVIPAGTSNVKIAFRQSHLKRYDDVHNRWVNMNVYIWKGSVYHA